MPVCKQTQNNATDPGGSDRSSQSNGSTRPSSHSNATDRPPQSNNLTGGPSPSNLLEIEEDSVRKKPNYYWTDQTMDQAVSAILKDGMSVTNASKIFNVPRKILTERVGGRLPLPQSVTGNQPLATPPVQFQYVGQP
ncbi:uncharacterized protein LOC111126727 [Crassostrea virginica]